ncbi:MAG: hypothetical protein M3Y18_07365, partial [Candidatus Eremiobacteraeota bacterium]|nr:hypothetical protein [Candidatus Eremiobacteraeota bacterium]
MKPALWRPVALTFIAVAIVFVLYHMTLPDRQDFGLTFAASNTASGDKRVEAVARNSAAARAGIRRGDVVSYGSNEIQRAAFLYATPGSHVTVTVNGTRRVTFTGLNTAPIFIPGAAAIRLAFLLVAALLAWRRPEDAATRALVTFLWCFGVAVSLPNGVLPTPLLSLIFLQGLSLLLFFFGMGAAANFSARFPSGVAIPAARILAGIAQWLAVIASLAVVGVEFLNSSVTKSLTLNAPFFALFFVIGALVVATLIVSYVQGAPTDRPRRRWIFLLLGVGLGGPLVDVFVQAVFGLNPWVDELSLVPLGLLPLGLAYVILRHRVIDVGFVINRALVFAGVSA